MSTVSSVSTIPAPTALKLGGDIAADWERFRSEWNNYELAIDLSDAPAKKRAAVLLACVGSNAYAVFRTFKFENDDDKSDVEKIIEAFNRHCIGEANITYERYIFHQRVQHAGENFDEFLSDLRKFARSCSFGELEDSLIRDRIIIGIRDEPTRRRLLQIKKLSLTDAIDACKASEATSRRLRTMSGATAGEDVDALRETSSRHDRRPRERRSSSKPREQQHSSRDHNASRDQSSGRRCRYCDRLHGGPKEACPAYNQKCRKCQRLHHFEKVCRSSASTTKQRQVCRIDDEELLAVDNNSDSKRLYCRLNVNNKSVLFMLDCGSTANIIGLKEARAISKKLHVLQPAQKRLIAAVHGTNCRTDVSYDTSGGTI